MVAAQDPRHPTQNLLSPRERPNTNLPFLGETRRWWDQHRNDCSSSSGAATILAAGEIETKQSDVGRVVGLEAEIARERERAARLERRLHFMAHPREAEAGGEGETNVDRTQLSAEALVTRSRRRSFGNAAEPLDEQFADVADTRLLLHALRHRGRDVDCVALPPPPPPARTTRRHIMQLRPLPLAASSDDAPADDRHDNADDDDVPTARSHGTPPLAKAARLLSPLAAKTIRPISGGTAGSTLSRAVGGALGGLARASGEPHLLPARQPLGETFGPPQRSVSGYSG